MLNRCLLGFFLGCGLFALTACDSAEERAEEHFQTALEYIEVGDFARATIEFRNVFKLNGHHREARLTYARMQDERGDVSEAYGQYLRLVEQYPDDLEGRKALVRLAVETGNWEEIERHGNAAAKLAPEDPLIQATLTLIAVRQALHDEDSHTLQNAFDTARELLSKQPNLLAAHQVVINQLILDQHWTEAQAALDTALTAFPENMKFYMLRLKVLQERGDNPAIEAQLQRMLTRFPGEQNIQNILLGWYLDQGNIDAAEAFLRARVTPESDTPDSQVALIQFLATTRGSEAAKAELDSILATDTRHALTFRALRAALDFETGKTDKAIARLESALEGLPPSPEVNDAKVTLARMLVDTGNAVGARALLEEVLEADASHVDAMKLKARDLIKRDQTGDAIILLRAALGESPRDAQAMTLLAQAHERDGNRDLMAEMLALAVEASGSAPAESLSYAAYLQRYEKLIPAEDVLLAALRIQNENQRLLGALGTLYIQMQDWSRTQGVIDRLVQLEGGLPLANELTARTLAAQGQEDELLRFLGDLANQVGAGGPDIGIIRTHVNRGDLKAALNHVDQALQQTPGDMTLRLLRGTVLAVSARHGEAEAAYRTLLKDAPKEEPVWIALYRLQLARGDSDAARQVVDEGLVALPDSPRLQWALAIELEQGGDINGAIAVYEALYARDSDNPIIANNLASLLATHRDDSDSLSHAWEVARRLRGQNIPAFQDTYGWVVHRRGDYEDALAHLEPAARGLPDDPVVQYHLAATYAALGRNAKALEQFRKVATMKNAEAILDMVNAEITRLSEGSGAGTQEKIDK
ncbi:tetratricopeptide repeat protein [Aliiroseovarius subalbicans]|uniref:tetratricopeptide repeat protein n=1 Tax=Aliiroseovarius subalbicans TaxID=2925840 RepID=UPI001F56C373|nr:tetratricopeptide repeat protein [uncultured Aliiroseovarius sp.]MCI2401154.1 tetratricopeptide repeat protein [Aliiroseovarius subalbicans]